MLVQLGGLRPEAPKVVNNGSTMEVDGSSSNVAGASSNGSETQSASTERDQLRRDVVLLIQQLCVMGKNVQLPARMALFRSLSDRGILFAVQWALGQPEGDDQGLQMICTGGEILTALLDHDLNGVRGHVLKQIGPPGEDMSMRKPDTDTLVSLMCRVLTRSRDMGVQSQVGESLRVLMEIPQGEAADAHVSHLELPSSQVIV